MVRRIERVWRARFRGGLVALLGVFAALPLCSQDLRFRRHQSWSVEDGLPQSSVHRVLQSRDGFIWIATEGGVARFDGVSFRVFRGETEPAFTSDDVCCIAEDAAGDLWFGTADGLVRLRHGRFEHVGEREGLASPAIVSLLATPTQPLLVLTSAGLAVWSEDRLQPVRGLSGHVVTVAGAAEGPVFILGEDGLFQMRGDHVTRSPIMLPSSAAALVGVAAGAHGAIWLRSADAVFALDRGTWRTWQTGRDLPGSRVESLAVDRSGTAWAGTNAGLALLRPDEAGATPVPALQGAAVLCVTEDREGNQWIGTDAAGLHVLRELPFRSEPGLADTPITSVVQATDGAVWVGTREDGLRRVRAGGTVDQPVRARDLTSPVVLSLAPGTAGSVWVGTPDGLNHVEASGTVRRITAADGLPDEFIRSIATDPDGSLWIGTRRGLAHLRGAAITTLTRADGLGSDLIGTLLATRQSGPAGAAMQGAAPPGLWIGTSGGLSFLDRTGRIRVFGPRDGIAGQIVTGMAQDRSGALWVTTQGGGVSRYAGDGRFRSTHLAAPDDRVEGIAIDGRNDLWVRGARGVRRVAIDRLTRCLEDAAACDPMEMQYGVADGLPSEDAVPGGSPSLWRGEGDELWFATRRGLAIADAGHLAFNPVPPPVVMERFSVDDQVLPLDGSPITIPFGHGRFTMEYAGLSFTVPSKVRYRFKLEGFDRDWTRAGTRRSATYTNLPPRAYRFRVEAMNNDGVWNRAGAELAFRVVPPFYRRWWFFVLAGLALIATGIALYRLRLRRLQRQFAAVLAERNRIAREIHDTLAQDFVGVSLHLEIVSQMLAGAKVEAAAAQIEQTRQLVRDGIAEARESIWELRANTAQDSLPTRLTRLANRYAGAETTVHVGIGGVYRALDPALENEVLRIAQEALTNVKKHASAGRVDISLQYDSDALLLTIRDNGRGFAGGAHAAPEGHYGVRGMHERAAQLRGRLEVRGEPGAGTSVTLVAPIAAAER